MKTFVYGARLEPGDERGVVVSFPDVPEAITQVADEKDAIVQAQDALGLALLTYPARGKPLDPAHPSKLSSVTKALRELGQRLIISVEAG